MRRGSVADVIEYQVGVAPVSPPPDADDVGVLMSAPWAVRVSTTAFFKRMLRGL